MAGKEWAESPKEMLRAEVVEEFGKRVFNEIRKKFVFNFNFSSFQK